MNTEQQTVLFVDDEKNVLASLRRLFYDVGPNLLFANSGIEGLEILKKENVDLIVSDVRMPEMDGIEFLNQVKQLYPHITRIFLSGYADQKAVVQALSEGSAQQILPKPWQDEELVSIVQKALLQAADLKSQNLGLHRIINSISSLPPMPGTYLELKNCLARKDTMDIDKISDIIGNDAGVSAEILRWANSVLFGQTSRVDTVSRAVAVLGMDIVEGLVLSESFFHTLADGAKIPGFDLADYQTHTISCSILSRLLVAGISDKSEDADRAFTAGLLHDIGKLLEKRFFANEFKNIISEARRKKTVMKEVEHDFLKTTHEEVGSLLAQWWNMPAFIINVNRWHHKPHLSSTDVDIISAVHVADILVHMFEMGASGNFRIPDKDQEIWSRFDLTEEVIMSLKDEVMKALPMQESASS